MISTQSNETSAQQGSSLYNFADFSMGAAGTVIAFLLKLVEIYYEVGTLDNELAAMNAKTSIQTAAITGKTLKDQGKQQKIAQMLTGFGQIAGAAISLGTTLGGEYFKHQAMKPLKNGEEYLKPVEKATGGGSTLPSEQQPSTKKLSQQAKDRIQEMKVSLDITKKPSEVTSATTEAGAPLSDENLLKLLDDDDIEEIQKHARSQIDQYTNEVRGKTETLRLVSQALETLPQGAATATSARFQQLAKNDEALAAILQNLTGIANSNNSAMQGKSDSEFGMITGVAQYIAELLNANKYS